jgi:multidrug transporter EmrE-like cation transporter
MSETIRWKTISHGTAMAIIDTIVLSALKAKALGLFDGLWVVLGAMVVYAFQPLIFFSSLKSETMTVMNLYWDLASDVLVTFVGLFMFKEELSPRRMLGVALSFVSLCLLSC